MRTLFPFSEIDKGSRVVLYGAGEAGYDFFRQLSASQYCKIILWVDKQWEWFRSLKLPVDPPEMILSTEYDLIVVTADQKETYESIWKDLTQMGVDENRIFWKEVYYVGYDIVARYDLNRIRKESSDAFLVNPIELFTEDRLDLTVRYIYARELKERLNNSVTSHEIYRIESQYESWYRRMMMTQNNGSEPTEYFMSAYFSEYSCKSGWKSFRNGFIELLDSMKADGFIKDYFVPVDINGRILNGAHRVAGAAALNLKMWARRYPYRSYGLCFDKDWFYDNGFSKDEVRLIYKEYEKIVS